jgi:hypothetical protein
LKDFHKVDVSQIEFGIDSFGDRPRDDQGETVSHAQAIRAVVTEAVLADQIGIDVVALGEHHRPEFAISSPETVLAGIATATQRIRLASGVTVLSSDDPVRVFQRFATVDALSSGRAEVILGRGSFTESFPLFGYDLKDYEVLFEEKIDLFHRLLDEKPVTWEGTTGRLLAVLIMIFGVSLFLRLVQVMLRPSKVQFRCPRCGLSRHDFDAVHIDGSPVAGRHHAQLVPRIQPLVNRVNLPPLDRA